ncbi:MAG: hypothetical protein AB1453_04210 [Chloroflexota bacterium]|jgi:Sec-independent protein translocase protein TatA
MEIFNLGLGEVVFILILALILLGPEGMADAGKKIGRMMRSVIKSPFWRMFINTTRDIREMPSRLAREAGLEEFNQNTKKFREEYLQDLEDQAEQDSRSVDPRHRPVPFDTDTGALSKSQTSPPAQENSPGGEPGSGSNAN